MVQCRSMIHPSADRERECEPEHLIHTRRVGVYPGLSFDLPASCLAAGIAEFRDSNVYGRRGFTDKLEMRCSTLTVTNKNPSMPKNDHHKLGCDQSPGDSGMVWGESHLMTQSLDIPMQESNDPIP